MLLNLNTIVSGVYPTNSWDSHSHPLTYVAPQRKEQWDAEFKQLASQFDTYLSTQNIPLYLKIILDGLNDRNFYNPKRQSNEDLCF